MSAIDERVAYIRMFTVPGRPAEVFLVHQYAALAADWERLRLRLHRNRILVRADDERFSTLTMILRRLSIELGLKTCTAKTAGSEDVAGITGRRGFLPNDPSYLQSSTWADAVARWSA